MSSLPLASLQPSEPRGVGSRDDIDGDALNRILGTLRALASFAMARERADHTLQPTALVHELLIKILTDSRVDFRDEPSFRAWAAKAIRHHLIDHARRRAAAKRGGGARQFQLDEAGDIPGPAETGVDLLHLTEALEKLRMAPPRSAEVVTFKVFGGLGQRETADRLGVSERTVRMDWVVARAWLYRELQGG